MQVQTAPGAPIMSYPGTQAQVAVIPQAPQQQVMIPTQQIPNSQVMYATPTAMPTQAVVPQVVQPDPAPLMAMPAPGVTLGVAVTGQTDFNTAQYGVPGIQQLVRKYTHIII